MDTSDGTKATSDTKGRVCDLCKAGNHVECRDESCACPYNEKTIDEVDAMDSTKATFDNPTTETRLRRFARDVIEKAMEGYNFDGDDVQEIAVKHGLLKEVTVTESCGETCTCAEVVDFPTTCYRFTDAMEPAQYA